jgi:hypothetical protein
MTIFSLDAVAWLAEHRRQNAELIQLASIPAKPAAEAERPAPALQPQLICC